MKGDGTRLNHHLVICIVKILVAHKNCMFWKMNCIKKMSLSRFGLMMKSQKISLNLGTCKHDKNITIAFGDSILGVF